MNSFFTKNQLENCIRLLGILFYFNYEITIIIILLLLIQNTLTKNNTLNIYSSGLFFTYNETKKIIKNLTIIGLIYFSCHSIELCF